MKTKQIEATKRGFPAMWESGGGMTSGGSATIIAKRDGGKPRPVYVRRRGHLACGHHALICVHEGFYVVRASVARGARSSASISRIVSVSVKDIDGEKWEAKAEVEEVNTFSRGEWDKPLDEKLVPAVEAAFSKASVYHCRRSYYIDTSPREEPSEAEKKRRKEEMRRQDEKRAKLRQAKAEREAREKAKREAVSKAANEAGLGARLEAVNARLSALGRETVELGDVSFKWGWQNKLYTEENVARVERQIEKMEREAAEEERNLKVQEQFQPQFEAFQSRVEEIDMALEFSDDRVRMDGPAVVSRSFPYSDEGLVRFGEHLERLEAEAIETRRQAEALAEYNKAKAEAAELGLPQNVEIWKRTGGRTNAGNGWVIGPDGQDRDPTSMWNHNPRRLKRYGEGYMVWEQILPGEVVLQWSKATSAAPHEFEVIHLPAEELTEAQLERIREIQDELEADWEGARGLASGEPSPPVGEGWGLLPQSSPDPSGGQYTLDDLREKFNSR